MEIDEYKILSSLSQFRLWPLVFWFSIHFFNASKISDPVDEVCSWQRPRSSWTTPKLSSTNLMQTNNWALSVKSQLSSIVIENYFESQEATTIYFNISEAISSTHNCILGKSNSAFSKNPQCFQQKMILLQFPHLKNFFSFVQEEVNLRMKLSSLFFDEQSLLRCQLSFLDTKLVLRQIHKDI